MSRIGNKIITIPSGVDVKIDKSAITVKGPKGTLIQAIDPDMKITSEDGIITISRPTEQKRHKSLHGLTRALVSNMVTGVSDGFTKQMELVGVGYRVSNTGNLLELSIGYSHPIMFYIPSELKVETVTEKGSNPKIILKGSDLQLIGQVCAKLRSFKAPEPFKGKGIKFTGEILRRKAGKSAGK
ncbi:MAG: 50S ribosomal protein L6 [Saprospiraceae bacterium]|nr:50S ribosomal protein L6 [Saprospiraceae bacterium]MBK8449330.1 50S ribosomal protein L6 [Saprospiraceae bacterium]MBK8484599.1 50S ribosomal protein L6 [Saprospiraceae bacterium]MBK9222026.1 50S ribosomal protein L6 [Saprospiraceae bacterium]MBK9721064.1 50S ribosomal protein L6 [Saprospiraceae bacterium]